MLCAQSRSCRLKNLLPCLASITVLCLCWQYKENLEMRMKYADQPEKFMESEVDLDEEVQRLLAVAGSPELYPEFVKLGAVENLMALLSHENTDIAADVIDLFQQLTDADVIEDSVRSWLCYHGKRRSARARPVC